MRREGALSSEESLFYQKLQSISAIGFPHAQNRRVRDFKKGNCYFCGVGVGARLIFLLPVQHLTQHIAQVGSSGSWRSLRLLTLIAADCRACGLLLVLLLLLTADCIQNPADAALLLLSCGLLAVSPS